MAARCAGPEASSLRAFFAHVLAPLRQSAPIELPHLSKLESSPMRDRTRARELARESLRQGDPLGWFERLYREAGDGKSVVPWADLGPNPHLLDFWKNHPQQTAGKSALVIGSGLGDDAELLAAWGFRTTAFDISASAIRATLKRFPNSAVAYSAADLFSPPPAWHAAFDFVFEAYTLQVLPENLRPRAIEKIASFVKPRGLLLLIARGREPGDPPGELPWPLTRAELRSFENFHFEEVSFEDFLESEEPDVRRFRALYRRAG